MCVIPWAGEYQLSWWAGNHTPQPAVVQRTMSSGRVPHLKSVDSCPVPRWSESPSHMHPVQHAVRLRRLSSHNVTDSVLNVNTHTDMAYIQLDRSSNRMTAYSPKKDTLDWQLLHHTWRAPPQKPPWHVGKLPQKQVVRKWKCECTSLTIKLCAGNRVWSHVASEVTLLAFLLSFIMTTISWFLPMTTCSLSLIVAKFSLRVQ